MQKFTPLELNTTALIEKVYSLHFFEYTRDFSFSGEVHNFWELVYADAGELVITAGNRKLTLKSGQLHLHRPMDFHNIRCGATQRASAIIFSFSATDRCLYGIAARPLSVNEQQQALLHAIITETKNAFSSPIDRAFENFLTPAENPPYGSDRLIVNAIETLLITLLRRYFDPARVPALGAQSPQEQLFSEICRFIDENHTKRLNLSMLCAHFRISESALKKLFSGHAGMGAMEYCISCRVGHAKEQIKKGGMNFTEIAYATGFSSVHYFSRCFKQHTGRSPRAYAKDMLPRQSAAL